MNSIEMLRYSDKFYSDLEDDYSRALFEYRLQLAIDRDQWKYRKSILGMYKEEWIIPELDRIVEEFTTRNIYMKYMSLLDRRMKKKGET